MSNDEPDRPLRSDRPASAFASSAVPVVPWRDLRVPLQKTLLPRIREIFYDASATRSFASEDEKSAFEERWLGRYLVHDPAWFYVAVDRDGRAAGYLAGSIDDPAAAPRFSDIGYFAELADLTAQYPAHLHINLAPQFRSRGIGARLIAAFMSDLEAAGTAGVHVVTGRGVRNTRFYAANGFKEQRVFPWKSSDLVFLGRRVT